MGVFNTSQDSNNNNNGNGRKMATAFLNFSLQLGDRKFKIVGAPLYADRVFDAQLIDALKNDPEKAQGLVSKLILTFNMADGSSSEPVDLSFLDEEAAA